ncbi:MAG: hypothetical protein DME18_07695 [Verrucomicrobia bacterium]|nr:MAG: hypothetical protein DME18_07695 [Verrucomicrobiota bacterium]
MSRRRRLLLNSAGPPTPGSSGKLVATLIITLLLVIGVCSLNLQNPLRSLSRRVDGLGNWAPMAFILIAHRPPGSRKTNQRITAAQQNRNEIRGARADAWNRTRLRAALSGLFHKYAHVRGNGFWAEARRERRAYPAVDL